MATIQTTTSSSLNYWVFCSICTHYNTYCPWQYWADKTKIPAAKIPIACCWQDHRATTNSLVLLNMAPSTTFDMKGRQAVLICIIGRTAYCMTFSLCIFAAWDKLKPMLIFCGKLGGSIVSQNFPDNDHNDKMLSTCQEQAKQHSNNMLALVNNALCSALQEHA